MNFGFMPTNSTVEVSDDGTISIFFVLNDDGTTSIIRHDEEDQELSDLIRYQSDDLEDEMFDTPTDFMKVTDEQINQLFQLGCDFYVWRASKFPTDGRLIVDVGRFRAIFKMYNIDEG